MAKHTATGIGLTGFYRDVLRDADGRVRWDSGVRKNVIVGDCRRLLAAFMHGAPNTTTGILGIKVGAGYSNWDQIGTPPASATTPALIDPNPFVLPLGSAQLSYLSGPNVSGSPTNRLQIVATLGPGVPPWPHLPDHVDGTLREFGLYGKLDTADVLIDYVTHPAIIKDPASTLDRTVWLVF
jgi:hypothetical protein